MTARRDAPAAAAFLGAAVDELGRRKVWLAAIVAVMCPLIAVLWFVRADGAGLPLMAAMWIVMLLNVLFPYTEVLRNSLLARAAGLRRVHEASGLALAFTAWALALPGHVGWHYIAPGKPQQNGYNERLASPAFGSTAGC